MRWWKRCSSIKFSGAYALYPLNMKWSEAYTKLHPEIRFNIQPGGAGKGLTDALAGNVDAGMLSREIGNNELNKNVWYIALAQDAVFPTINSNNPYIGVLKARGWKKEALKQIFTGGKVPGWEALLNQTAQRENSINVYTRSDASGAAESWSAYFGLHQDDLKGIGMLGDPGIADAVKRDAKGIGYNNPQYVFDLQTGRKIPGIEILPLDVNGNGSIDSSENFYESLGAFEAAVKNGQYPSPPVRYLYFVCKEKPTNRLLLDYFKWVLTTGQQFIKGAGYVPLTAGEISAQLEKLQ